MTFDSDDEIVPAGTVDIPGPEDENYLFEDSGDKTGDNAGDKTGDNAGDKTGDKTGDDAGDKTGDKTGGNADPNTNDKSATSDDPNTDKSGDAGELDGKSADELKAMVEDAKAFQGRQAQEIGDLRSQLSALQEQVNASSQQQQQQQQAATPTPEDQLKELAEGFTNGTVPFEQVLLTAFKLGSDTSRDVASQEFASREQQRIFEMHRDNYLGQNTDFMDLLNSGEIDRMKQTAPGIHNDVSAYEAIKRANTEKALADLTAQHADLKAQLDAALKAGSKPQDKVITSPGQGTRAANGKRSQMSEGDGEQFLMNKLSEYRASQA